MFLSVLDIASVERSRRWFALMTFNTDLDNIRTEFAAPNLADSYAIEPVEPMSEAEQPSSPAIYGSPCKRLSYKSITEIPPPHFFQRARMAKRCPILMFRCGKPETKK